MTTRIEIDADVAKTAEFLQATFPASRLVAIAKGIGAIAPFLWDHYRADDIELIRLKSDASTAHSPDDDRHTRSNASE